MINFELSLGPKQGINHTLRHDNDACWEIYIDFPGGECSPMGAGILQTARDVFSGKIRFWAVVDENGNPLPGCRTTYATKRAAMEATRTFVDGLINQGETT